MQLVLYQRTETNGVLARNVEFSQIIVDYQRKLRESSESLHAAEELSRKLNMEVLSLCYKTTSCVCCLLICGSHFVCCYQQVSVLKNEKEMLVNAEKRALDEVRNLSQRVHRLQVVLSR